MSESVPSQEEAFGFLADPATHGLNAPVGRVDTAGAVVFLAGADVYKVKRAVTFPFMDLSTLDKRRLACEAEIAVNRASAPGIYLAALPITRSDYSLWATDYQPIVSLFTALPPSHSGNVSA